MNQKTFVRLALVAFATVLIRQDVGAQTYSRGQHVTPAYEGWVEHADGSRSFVFGYMNQNWEEELDVPIGPDNLIEPGGPDLGQPTHFQPRRNRFTFMVPVPKGFKDTDEVRWKLTTRGEQAAAYATLRPDYKLDNITIASETGAIGGGGTNPESRANKPPTLTVDGPKALTVKVGAPLTLRTTITDDGVPKTGTVAAQTRQGPRPGAAAARSNAATPRVNPVYVPPTQLTPGKFNFLHVSWFLYRGTAAVTFNPPQILTWEDTRTGANSPWSPLWQPPTPTPVEKQTVQVTFSKPGTYVLRARGEDGMLYVDDNVTVTVVP